MATYKAGWEAGPGGGNMVRNTRTGQVLDTNHPLYQDDPQAAPPPVAAPPTDTAPAIKQAAPSAPAPAAAPPPILTAQDVTSTTAPVGQAPAQGAPTSVAQSFQQALVNRLNPGPVDTTNPAIAPAIQANQLAEQRNFEANRNLLAERAAANGTNQSGGFETGLLGLAQDRAGREGQFAGQAVQGLQDQLNQNTTGAMGMAGSLLSGQQSLAQQGGQFGQSLAEQARQANQAAELQRLGINTQGSLGQGDLALRGRLGEANVNLGLLSALLQNDQFGRSLGQNASQFGASLDQSGLLGLLGLL